MYRDGGEGRAWPALLTARRSAPPRAECGEGMPHGMRRHALRQSGARAVASMTPKRRRATTASRGHSERMRADHFPRSSGADLRGTARRPPARAYDGTTLLGALANTRPPPSRTGRPAAEATSSDTRTPARTRIPGSAIEDRGGSPWSEPRQKMSSPRGQDAGSVRQLWRFDPLVGSRARRCPPHRN